MSDTPAQRTPGFLVCLKEVVKNSPSLTDMVDKSIELHNFQEMIRYYELRNPALATNTVRYIAGAVAIKMQLDLDANVVGTKTFTRLIENAIAFGLIAGAHLAKEREL